MTTNVVSMGRDQIRSNRQKLSQLRERGIAGALAGRVDVKVTNDQPLSATEEAILSIGITEKDTRDFYDRTGISDLDQQVRKIELAVRAIRAVKAEYAAKFADLKGRFEMETGTNFASIDLDSADETEPFF